MARLDPHSFCDDTQAQTVRVQLAARVDFATRTLAGTAELIFAAPYQGPLDLDTRDLTIEHVESDAGTALAWKLHEAEPHYGARLSIDVATSAKSVRIRYKTSPEASALQWLEPAQTSGGKQPFLFSQCQAIHARSVIPLQDTPRLRITYRATIEYPKELRLVMAAADRGRSDASSSFAGTRSTPEGSAESTDRATATHTFEMPQPIPPYLFAFAIGDLVHRDISDRCRVWAEPAVVDAAASEFRDVEAMIGAAEKLFGPYDWERFDILTMPPSFPYGGMENPRLTFLTPTVIAGDRSLVSVVAHELAHSWTGNLVTNANAEHFWLNEGFTMYAERRITEALHGADVAALEAALGRRELDESFERFKKTPGMTRLRTHLAGIDPDDGYSLIPYEKGYLFLCAIEAVVGRPAFEAWLKTYLHDFRFGAITTADFEAHIERALPGALAKANARAWIDGEGLPPTAAMLGSTRLDAIEALRGAVPTKEQSKSWTPVEWALYLETIPRPAPEATCRALDEQYKLTQSTNFDVLVPWLTLALKSHYTAVLPRVKRVLAEVGRMKYLRPLYTSLASDPSLRAEAVSTFDANRASYHPIARQMVEGVLRATR